MFLTTEKDINQDDLFALIKLGEGMMSNMLENGDVSIDQDFFGLDSELIVYNEEVYDIFQDVMSEGRSKLLEE